MRQLRQQRAVGPQRGLLLLDLPLEVLPHRLALQLVEDPLHQLTVFQLLKPPLQHVDILALRHLRKLLVHAVAHRECENRRLGVAVAAGHARVTPLQGAAILLRLKLAGQGLEVDRAILLWEQRLQPNLSRLRRLHLHSLVLGGQACQLGSYVLPQVPELHRQAVLVIPMALLEAPSLGSQGPREVGDASTHLVHDLPLQAALDLSRRRLQVPLRPVRPVYLEDHLDTASRKVGSELGLHFLALALHLIREALQPNQLGRTFEEVSLSDGIHLGLRQAKLQNILQVIQIA
mmetsp:Transcript_126361/g.300011  ORF Transcript_126361/g.300011 Transcript_126361/m.300011 type:complete len:290 (+) Transcript_126361:619-1488(+)